MVICDVCGTVDPVGGVVAQPNPFDQAKQENACDLCRLWRPNDSATRSLAVYANVLRKDIIKLVGQLAEPANG